MGYMNNNEQVTPEVKLNQEVEMENIQNTSSDSAGASKEEEPVDINNNKIDEAENLKGSKKRNKKKEKKTTDKLTTAKSSKSIVIRDKLKEMLIYVGEQTLPLRRQIRFKLVIAFFVPALLIIALGLFSYYRSQGTVIANYEKSSAGNIENSALYISLLMKDIETKASQVAGLEDFYFYYTKFNENSVIDSNTLFTSARTTLSTFVSSSVGIYGAYAFGSMGNAMSTLSANPSSTLFADFEASEEAAKWREKSKTIGGATSAWLGNHPVIDKGLSSQPDQYAASYIRKFYRGEGYIVFDLMTSEINTVLDNSISSEKSIVAFVTPDGRETLVTGKKSALAGIEKGEAVFANSSFYKKALESDKVNGMKYVTINKKSNLFVYSKVGETGAMVCTLIPRSDILSQLNTIRIATAIFVVISFLIAIFIGLYLSTDIARAINRFSVAFKHISAGDFTTLMKSKRKDEFGALAQDMDNTMTTIKNLIAEMATFGHNVSDSAYKVSEASTDILSSINEVSSTVNVMSQGVGEQAKDTEKSFLQMTDFAAQIGEAYTDTTNVGNVANNTQQIISNGKNIVDNLIDQVTATSEITNVIIKDIEELERHSKSIGSVVGTINDIASTTNLLSLNASIEAARAGDAGRGFAVVADQIRNLAEQSVESVKSIEKIIQNIQQKTQVTVASANRAEQLLGSQTEALNNTVKVFQDVDGHMIELLEKMNHITNNMGTITVSKDEVLDAIKNIAAVTEETLASSEVVDTNVSNQITAIETLNQQAEEMKEKAKELEEAIAKFKI